MCNIGCSCYMTRYHHVHFESRCVKNAIENNIYPKYINFIRMNIVKHINFNSLNNFFNLENQRSLVNNTTATLMQIRDHLAIIQHYCNHMPLVDFRF